MANLLDPDLMDAAINALREAHAATINASAIKGEPGTGFESRIVNGVDKGPFECGNCEYFNGTDACDQKDMMAKSKRERHKDGTVVTGPQDCCEYVDRKGE